MGLTPPRPAQSRQPLRRSTPSRAPSRAAHDEHGEAEEVEGQVGERHAEGHQARELWLCQRSMRCALVSADMKDRRVRAGRVLTRNCVSRREIA
eukprot:1758542-Rhodomonas_salina.1